MKTLLLLMSVSWASDQTLKISGERYSDAIYKEFENSLYLSHYPPIQPHENNKVVRLRMDARNLYFTKNLKFPYLQEIIVDIFLPARIYPWENLPKAKNTYIKEEVESLSDAGKKYEELRKRFPQNLKYKAYVKKQKFEATCESFRLFENNESFEGEKIHYSLSQFDKLNQGY